MTLGDGGLENRSGNMGAVTASASAHKSAESQYGDQTLITVASLGTLVSHPALVLARAVARPPHTVLYAATS